MDSFLLGSLLQEKERIAELVLVDVLWLVVVLVAAFR